MCPPYIGRVYRRHGICADSAPFVSVTVVRRTFCGRRTALQRSLERLLLSSRGGVAAGAVGWWRLCDACFQARLAAFVGFMRTFQIEISKQYKHREFLEDLKKMYEVAGTKGNPLMFLFSDTEIVEESFLEDRSCLSSSGVGDFELALCLCR